MPSSNHQGHSHHGASSRFSKIHEKFRKLTTETLREAEINQVERKQSVEKHKGEKVEKHEKETHEAKDCDDPAHCLEHPNPKFEGGKTLPPSLGDYFPKKKLAGIPLVDIDPYYHDKGTFVVIGSDKTIFRFTTSKGFYLFGPLHPIRKTAIRVLTHPIFSFLVLATIITNCVFMARNDKNKIVEYVFTAIYTFEFAVKAGSRGLILTQFTYLRDAWNWLDFIVISLAYIMFAVPQLGNLSALRSLRVLRALKTVTTVPGMKTVVGALIEAVKQLRDVLVLTIFILSIIALIGLQLYRGTLLKQCVREFNVTDQGYDLDLFQNLSEAKQWEIKYEFFNNESNWDNKRCTNYSSSGSWESPCGNGSVCVQTKTGNPNYGFTNFDNFISAWLCAFRLMTQDFWENLYQLTLRCNGDIHMIYFMVVMFFGSFYLINVILAIVAMSYDDVRMAIEAEQEDEEAEKKIEEENREKVLEQIDDELGISSSSEDLNFQVMTLSPHQNPRNYQKANKPDHNKSHWSITSYKQKSSNNFLLPVVDVDEDSTVNSYEESLEFNEDKEDLHSYNEQIPRNISEFSTGTNNQYTCPLQEFYQERVSFCFVDKSEANTQSSTPIINKLAVNNQGNVATSNPSFVNENNGNKPLNNIVITNKYLDPGLHIPSFVTPTKSRMVNNKDGSLNVFKRNLSKKLRRKFSKADNADDIEESGLSETLLEDNEEDSTFGEVSKFMDHDPELQSAISALSIYELENRPPKWKQRLRDWFMRTFCSWHCCPAYKRFKIIMGLIILDPFMELFITICIATNTIFMALDMPFISVQMKNFLVYSNFFFTITFTMEAFMKLIALGHRIYFQDSWNIFDFIIVILSLVEIPLNSYGISLSLLRAFRLLRVFKLAKSWKTMNMLFSIIGSALGAIGNLCIVLGIIIFIFAVVGMQLFGENYHKLANITEFPQFKGKVPRWNFLDFTHSFMIVFRVLCGEWIESMWDCMLVNGYYCVPFFFMTMMLGNLVLLSLFLALLLGAFGSESMQRRDDDSEETNKLQEAIARIYRAGVWIKLRISKSVKVIKRYICRKTKSKAKSLPSWLNINNYEKNSKQKVEFNITDSCHVMENPHWPTSGVFKEESLPNFQADPEVNDVELVYSSDPEDCLPMVLSNKMLGCYGLMFRSRIGRGWWSLRCFCNRIVEHSYFETFIIVMIVISSLTLTLEDKFLDEKPTLKIVLAVLDKIFTIIFTLEMLLKWLALGLNKYFKDAWCWLDFVIVAIALVSLLMPLISKGSSNIGAFKAMRTLRALRPLRAVSRWEGMRIVVNALIQAIPSIVNVLVVCLVFWLIFSIIGMQLLGGKFYKCIDNDTEVRISANIVTSKNDCLTMQKLYGNVSWVNSDINFDNIFVGYLALFQIATFKGWTEIMADAVDATDIDKQPIYNNSTFYYIYFVLFIIFGAFFTLNLFIGVIIENFNVQKKKVGGSIEMFMTEDQKKYYAAMKKMSNNAPKKPIPKPKMKFARFIFQITNNQTFDIIIMSVIMMNTIVMCIEHWNQSETLKVTLDQINKVFIIIFTCEFLLKIIGQRWHYFTLPWNVFDFVIVILSIVFWAIENMLDNIPVSPTLIRIVRVFRIGRVLRLVKSARGIRTLLFSLIVSLPALLNIAILLCMIMFIYAIVGMSFFSNVAYSHSIDEVFNFETFGKSMIILFQISTSGGWNGVLNGLMNTDPKICDENKKNCGSFPLAVFFLCSYLIMSCLVIINMYIAVILENFTQATKDVQEGLTQEDYDMFYESWEEYDNKARGFIQLEYLEEFVGKIGKPLGIERPNKIQLALLEIPICQGDTVYCVDLLDILTKNFLNQKPGAEVDPGVNNTDNMEAMKPNQIKTGVEKIIITNTFERQKQNWAAKVITRYMHKYVDKYGKSSRSRRMKLIMS